MNLSMGECGNACVCRNERTQVHAPLYGGVSCGLKVSQSGLKSRVRVGMAKCPRWSGRTTTIAIGSRVTVARFTTTAWEGKSDEEGRGVWVLSRSRSSPHVGDVRAGKLLLAYGGGGSEGVVQSLNSLGVTVKTPI